MGTPDVDEDGVAGLLDVSKSYHAKGLQVLDVLIL